MFTISYVVVTVKARLEGMDIHIDETAMDLGANEWTTFRKVTLPMIAPGLAAAGLLAFVISLALLLMALNVIVQRRRAAADAVRA